MLSKKIDDKLCKNFPNLYRARKWKKNKSLLAAYGFECKDGWYKLLSDLSEQLERYIISLPEKDQENLYAEQVKQKFYKLKVYMNRYDEFCNETIQAYEALSEFICETCGKEKDGPECCRK